MSTMTNPSNVTVVTPITDIIRDISKLLTVWSGEPTLYEERLDEVLTSYNTVRSYIESGKTITDPFHMFVSHLYPEDYNTEGFEEISPEEIQFIENQLKNFDVISQMDTVVEYFRDVLC